ncbi:Centromere protein [Altererythrobacter insulae]|nr:Centromere protein [Altererythrobacter insulae]
MTQSVEITGGCHCGAVRFEATVDSRPEVWDCNCSICSKSAYLHLFIPHEDFRLKASPEAQTSYRFGKKEAEHLFCKSCGVKSFYQPRSHPNDWSVNLRCLDNPDALTPTIVPFDGKNWEAAAEGRV